MIYRAFLLIVLTPLLLACAAEGRTGPLEPQDATGYWFGVTDPDRAPGLPTVGIQRDTLEILLEEDLDGRITGSGTIRGRGEGRAFLVEGSSQFPFLFLTLLPGGHPAAGGAQLLNLRAEFTGAHLLTGRLTGDGFVNLRVRLQKQSPRVGL
jgi:hypothetical protein